jgi:hypothetical protein
MGLALGHLIHPHPSYPLGHHVTPSRLRQAYWAISPKAAPLVVVWNASSWLVADSAASCRLV